MIISRTPYRISLAGGLSDLPAYYNTYDGFVLSTTIDKYIYIIIEESFDNRFKLHYSKIENVDSVDKIQHPLIRECLNYLHIDKPLIITSFSSVPGGTGLGSSSSFTVGLLNALHTFLGEYATKQQLAEETCEIEINILREPIGKQDQYAATYGGFNHLTFTKDNINVNRLTINHNIMSSLDKRLMLFYTNITRQSKSILTEQNLNMEHIKNDIHKLAYMTFSMISDLRNNKLDGIGISLDKLWKIKKTTGKMSNKKIDCWYKRAKHAGALGGKICGAGGGGFLLIYCNPDKQDEVRRALSDLYELKFKFEENGSSIIYEE